MTVSSNQLSSYIHTILNVAKVDQGTMKLRPQKADWKQVLLTASTDQVNRGKSMGHALKFSIPNDLPAVAVDQNIIQQVINNLLDNAIKYSRDGGDVQISVKVNGDFVETTITDKGVGIPSAVTDNLFKKFYRSHRSKQSVSGTGLGLFLCKAVVQAHGGLIWVQSKEEVGSTFGFSLPTFESVKDQVNQSEFDGKITRTKHGWIKNHSLLRK
jgi:K+-sensing histidine kinase KdpD